MKGGYRFEHKYLFDSPKVGGILAALERNMEPDSHSGSGGYLVQSLYYDTPDLQFLRDKIDGQKNRLKIRMRSYRKDNNDPVKSIFFEVKERNDKAVRKFRREILPAESEQFIRDRELTGMDLESDSAMRLNYALKRFMLVPQIIISYRRHAFTGGVYDRGLRVTVDTGLKSRRNILDLGVQVPEKFFISPLKAVLEVKCAGRIPRWLYSFVTGHGLVHQSLSKYAIGMESSLTLERKKRIPD